MQTSYSALDTFRQCPLKYKYQEIDGIKVPKSKEAVFGSVIHATMKFIHTPALVSPTLQQALDYFSKNWNSAVFDSEIEERSAFSQGVQMTEDYYQKNNPAGTNVIDLESRFQITVGADEELHVISGIVDRIDKTHDGYEIIDYKTTRRMPSQEAVDSNFQLSIYLLAFLHRYPKEKENVGNIKVSLYYLKHGVKLSSERTLKQLGESEQLILEFIGQIQHSNFPPVMSPLCDWCGYQKMCPMWRHKFKELRKVDSEAIKDIIEEYVNLKDAVKISKTKLSQLQEKISNYMDQEGVDRVFGNGGIIARILRKTYKYNPDKLKAILESIGKWDAVVKVNTTALNKLLAALSPEIRKKVENIKEVDRETKSFSVKKQ